MSRSEPEKQVEVYGLLKQLSLGEFVHRMMLHDDPPPKSWNEFYTLLKDRNMMIVGDE